MEQGRIELPTPQLQCGVIPVNYCSKSLPVGNCTQLTRATAEDITIMLQGEIIF